MGLAERDGNQPSLDLPPYTPREAKYGFYLQQIFEGGGGERLVNLSAEYIRAANIQPEFFVTHHLHRVNPQDHNKECELTAALATELKRPHAILHQWEDGSRPPSLTGATPNGRILMVGDVARSGDTIVKTAQYLRESHPQANVFGVFVVIVRPEGKRHDALLDKLRDEHIRLFHITTAKEVLQGLHKNGSITQEQYDEAMQDVDFSEPYTSWQEKTRHFLRTL